METSETAWNTALWPQAGAAIDMLDNALLACPDSLWQEPLWPTPPTSRFPPRFAEFWYVSFHALVWLDLYLSGVPEEEFAPPAPFAQGEIDSMESQPERPYTKEELRAYLTSLRQKAHTTLTALTDERARRTVEYAWSQGQAISFLELQLYTMRHVQEHAAQLCLFLGQHGIPAEDLDSVARAVTLEANRRMRYHVYIVEGEPLSAMPDWNRQTVEDFRANKGNVGGVWEGRPLLLLTTTGAKSGQRRTNPMMYLRDGNRLFVFASKGGAPTNPDWFHNLLANPVVTVEIGDQTYDAIAKPVTGEERDSIYTKWSGMYPQFREYQKKTSRSIPVIELQPRTA